MGSPWKVLVSGAVCGGDVWTSAACLAVSATGTAIETRTARSVARGGCVGADIRLDSLHDMVGGLSFPDPN